MIEYEGQLNLPNENLGITEKTITANEKVRTADTRALAREIHHQNALIPEDVAQQVLNYFCKAAVEKMTEGFAIQLDCEKGVGLRIFTDIHVKGGNINLKRAKELDPTVTELTAENAGALIDKAGVTVRVRAVAQNPFTDLLDKEGYTLKRTAIVTKQGSQATDTHEEGDDNGQGEQPANGGSGDNGGDDLEG
jgi:hypothetical protein